jgi:hypothetical protein
LFFTHLAQDNVHIQDVIRFDRLQGGSCPICVSRRGCFVLLSGRGDQSSDYHFENWVGAISQLKGE